MGSIVRKNQRRICLKYRSILSINLVRYPILIEEKKFKKMDEEKSSKEPIRSKLNDSSTESLASESVYRENYLVFAKFSNQVAV